VLECVTPFMPILKFFPALTTDQFLENRMACGPDGLLHDKDTGEDWLVIPIQSFLLRTPRALVLVDACVGNHKTLPSLKFWNDMRSSRFLASLAAAGARVEDVTHVLCTHLHVDRVGWTTSLDEGQWVPTFPNACVLATKEDLDFAQSRAQAAPDSTSGWRRHRLIRV
jgi:glyoxylase-like metal-dependent hydrolase (beta-lactamase superfamily II)